MTSSEESAGAGEDMGDLLDSYEPMKPHRRGDVVEGIVMRADTDGIFVNIGDKSEGIVPPAEMRTLEPEALQQLEVGDEIVTLVVRGESGDRGAVLSIDRAQGEKGWRVLEKALEMGSSLEGTVAGFNRGGAIVEVEGVQGFVPMSQLVTVGRSGGEDAGAAEGETGEEPVKDPRDEDIGKVLQLKLLEVNRGRNRAILSERQALQEQRDELVY